MPPRPSLRSLLRGLGRRMPRVRGTLRVPGLAGEVTIARDRWGIPHVSASSDADAWFGLGFCHGQDRSFQLELLARAGRGRLAELLGPGAVPVDRLSRTLGFRRMAMAQRLTLDVDVAATLESYVAGINAARRSSPRPHELVLLRARPLEWDAEDVLAFQALQSLALAGNWDCELARLAILLTDGPEALAAVDETYAEWLPAVDPPGSVAGPTLGRLAADVAQLRTLVGGPGASNAWAVAGARTTTGRPILANDPHLGPDVPAPWYLAHLRTPDWGVAGASFVGGPAFPSGHNGHAAWGITAACTDAADLFWEEVAPGGDAARGPDGAEPLTRLREEIVVRGGTTVVEEVVLTPRGPLVTSLLDGVETALSLRATWLEPMPVRGFLDVARARSFEEFRAPFVDWPGPALNVVYADAEGHIGWQVVGSLPRRSAGNGTLPAPAWTAGWEERQLPFDDLPGLLDPEVGYVASSNNAPGPDDADAPFLGVDWLDGYRAAAIVERLAGRDDWDVAASAALQLDVTSIPWRELRDAVLAVTPSDADERVGLQMLRDWDGAVSAGSSAASVYELLVAHLAAALVRKRAPGSWRWAMGDGFGPSLPGTVFGARTVSRLIRMLHDGTDQHAAILASLRAAVRTLTRRHGADPAGWAWGRVRPLRLRHPLGGVRPLDRLLNVGPAPVGGDSNTVAQAAVRPLRPLGNPGVIANHRMIVDLADVERSRFAVAGGQSGNPLSPHYDDLFALWCRGDGVPIPWTPEAVAAATVDRLVLGAESVPQGAGISDPSITSP